MNLPILNREFRHPEDGWYQIEVRGEHLNKRSGVVQVLDKDACESIVNRFNAAARDPEFPGMLVDHEHFKHDQDKESRAYGWLMKLENRANGIYGQVKWTGIGRKAVDEGEYRYFSTEYDPADLVVLNHGKPMRVRPVKLDGLTLTNMPNNKGGKPITNRDPGEDLRRGVGAPAAGKDQNKNDERTKMKSVATKLGLSAEASEEIVLAEVTKVMNRAGELEGQIVPLQERVKTLEGENAGLVSEQIEADLGARGVTDEKVKNRLKPVLAKLANREERIAFLEDTGFKAVSGGANASESGRVLNRAGAKTPEQAASGNEAERAGKIRNRAQELQKSGLSFDAAFAQARQEVK